MALTSARLLNVCFLGEDSVKPETYANRDKAGDFTRG
jgi:hypothetical protein